MKKNSAENYECINVYLSEEKTPIAFATKLKELMEQKVFDNEDEAKKWIRTTPFEMEIYYSFGYGLFMVEAEAVEGGANIYDPYSTEILEEDED